MYQKRNQQIIIDKKHKQKTEYQNKTVKLTDVAGTKLDGSLTFKIKVNKYGGQTTKDVYDFIETGAE